jgi:arylsulfatase A-like enzyme
MIRHRRWQTIGVARFVAAGAILSVVSACEPAFAADAPRGIVVFIADDQAQADVGCYGNPVVRTPNVDRLAAEGLRFTQAFLTTSSCSPSRCSLLTGLYPHATHAEDLHTPLPADQKTIARYLRSAGWHCAAVGKWHLGNPEKKNWDQVVDAAPEALAATALATFAARDANKPFFFWIASTDPHRPYAPGAADPPHDPGKVIVPPFLPDDPRVREEIGHYYDEISRFDAQVGTFVAALAEQGIADDTLVVYLTDNGMPFARAKTTLYDSGIRTPLIWRWKKQIAAGKTNAALVSAVDLAPTLLELAGVKGEGMQGRSLVPCLKNPEKATQPLIFAEANWHDYEQCSRAVRSSRYKLIRNYYWDKPLWSPADSVNSVTWSVLLEWKAANKLTPLQLQPFAEKRAFEEFYDLEADPHESVNLAEEPRVREELWRLRAALDHWRVETEDLISGHRRPDGFTLEGKKIPLMK